MQQYDYAQNTQLLINMNFACMSRATPFDIIKECLKSHGYVTIGMQMNTVDLEHFKSANHILQQTDLKMAPGI